MNPAAAFIVSDMLADREARVPTFGLDNALATRYWSAVKTGTSKDMRDNWCIGFSKRHTVGVWVGNASGDPMWNVSGTSGAAPIWRTVMDELHREHPGKATDPPPVGLVQQAVRFDGNREAARSEWFLVGTEQSTVQLASQTGAARNLIHSPTDRTILALDPDIPPQAQKLVFTPVTGVSPNWSWHLDGKRLGPAVSTPWALWPGKHVLELVDARANAVEVVRFEVRGAQLQTPVAHKIAIAARKLSAGPATRQRPARSGLKPPAVVLAGQPVQVLGSVTPVCPWYLPPRSRYEVSQSSSLSKNSTWAQPSPA
jgi:penicillin-binding protein 1C